MRVEIIASALVHGAALAAMLIAWPYPPPEDAPEAGALAVSLITVSSFAANATEVLQSDASVSSISAGASATVPPAEPEVTRPVESTEALQPTATEPLTPAAAQPLQPAAVEPVRPVPAEAAPPVLSVAVLDPAAPDTVALQAEAQSVEQPMPQPAISAEQPAEALAPTSVTEQRTAPIPATLTIARTDRPIATAPPPERPRQQQPQQPQANPPSQAGNGGTSNADSVASASGGQPQLAQGAGGEAEMARYQSQVLSALRRALRTVQGARGEVLVRFTLSAGGGVTALSIQRSSGNPTIDAAGTATVQRAAFPPIPAAANRNSWTFDVPLAFGG